MNKLDVRYNPRVVNSTKEFLVIGEFGGGPILVRSYSRYEDIPEEDKRKRMVLPQGLASKFINLTGDSRLR